MSKHGAHHGRKHTKRVVPKPVALSDKAVWTAIGMVGVFVIALWYLVSRETWRHGVVGYLIAVAFLVNYYAWRVSTGHQLLAWQQPLARLPLRWVGYGTKGGKPLDAARGSAGARTMVIVSIALSMALIVVATWVLVPR